MPSLPLPRLSRPVVALAAGGALVVTSWGGSTTLEAEPAATPSEGDFAHAAAPELLVDGAAPAAVTDLDAAATEVPEATIPDVPEAPGDEDPTGDEAEAEQESEESEAPEALPDEVELHSPDIVLRDPGAAIADLDLDGVAHAAAVAEFTATTPAGDDAEPHELEVMAVDVESFRPLTPDVTAQSPDVWERLRDGDVLVRHDIAHELDLELGGRMILRTDHGTLPVRIGALAANGAPPLAEVLVPRDVAGLLGADDDNAVVLAAEDEDAEPLADRLSSVGEVELRREPEPERATPQPTGSGSVELEPFTYTSRGDGTIAIHGDWAARNIVPVEIPGMGTTRCHRKMVPQLMAALREIHEAGLYDHFDPSQFGGCWVPRHIMWNPSRGLSMHAWGLAIDFNVSTNMYGAEPQMHPGIVEIFKKWGFAWGGDWSTPDGMHFEVERFVAVE